MPIEYEPTETNIICRYANGVKLILDFLKAPFGDRSPHYVTRLAPVPVVSSATKARSKTGDEGEIRRSARSAPEAAWGTDNGSRPGRDGSFAQLLRLHQVSENDGRQSRCGCRPRTSPAHAAAIAWVLGRKLKLDP